VKTDTTRGETLALLEALLEDESVSFGIRNETCRLIAEAARSGRIDRIHIPRLYGALGRFWRSLGVPAIDRNNQTLFPVRKELAASCQKLSLRLPGGRRVFNFFPALSAVEGPHHLREGALLRGALTCTCGTSLYEFHWEYPIEGFGVRKDLIVVVANDGTRVPLLDWCRENDVIVFCSRCGLDITYEVSKDCPWRRERYGAR
jgi:hypothetical protein